MHRRTFLKLASLGTVAFAAGCTSRADDHLFSMVRTNEDMVTGRPTWYASACRECPAGCGVLAANREGRIIKLEGNPLHPVNRGALCMRGQSALQGIYHPDRVWRPRLKTGDGWQEIPFDHAAALISDKMQAAATGGRGRILSVTETVGHTQLALFSTVLAHHGAAPPVVFEPRGYEALKFAYQRILGQSMLPVLHMDRADLLVSFGADFLETWLSPVEYARKFKSMHRWHRGRKGTFIQVSPFQSLTGANADRWIACRPGSEAAVAMGILRTALAAEDRSSLNRDQHTALSNLAADFTPERVSHLSGVHEEILSTVARRLLQARRPLVLGTDAAGQGGPATATEMAVLFLNLALDPDLSLIDRNNHHRVTIADRRDTVMAGFEAMADPSVTLTLLNNVNPVFAMPEGDRIAERLQRQDLFVVAFANTMDETAVHADLVMPVQLALESWDAYESNSITTTTLQPTMGKITQAPSLGELWLGLLPAVQRTAGDYPALLAQTILAGRKEQTPLLWLQTIRQGGRFDAGLPAAAPPRIVAGAVEVLRAYLQQIPPATDAPILLTPPSIRFFDGRMADRPWIPEIPDPLSQVAWQSVAMIHPRVLATMDIKEGDRIALETASGRAELHAYGHPGLYPAVVVVSMGQGHTRMGRYARGQGINPMTLLRAVTDPVSGAPDAAARIARLTPGSLDGKALASVSGSRYQHGRRIALSVPAAKADSPPPPSNYLDMDHFPLTLPLPEGYDPRRDFYPPHDHHTYRWAMVVDLDRCIGCSACVAACYAENSIGIVGEDQVIAGREMAWIRIERYQDEQDPTRLIFLPMLCQHCDNAPCESVCPVYAPHHSSEGLNNQIYNRCIGTRYCGQNCPYKVRRFNWFTWQWPEPLHMQLNPDVTVRTAGVMEKCSFCVQRIKAARTRAKNENREIREGEVVPACVQTCPTGALHFGNLMDPESTVRELTDNPRAYQVMGYLNTKPAVIYLKKVIRQV